METHRDFSDTAFETRFANCAWDPADFSHEAHLRLAHIHITRYGAEQALQNIQTQLRKYVMHIGAEDKHHATLAVVAVRIMDHFMRESKSSEFDQLISEFPRLPNDFKALVNAHYTFDIFNSEKAK